MTQSAKPRFRIRPAKADDAATIAGVLRRSITELCGADHENDAAQIAEWLSNKTAEHVAGWIADPHNRLFVALDDERIVAAGCVRTSGEISLNYVAPDSRFRGVSRAMLRTLENTARELGHRRVTLTSTFTAHAFYLGAGFTDVETEPWGARDWPRMEKRLS